MRLLFDMAFALALAACGQAGTLESASADEAPCELSASRAEAFARIRSFLSGHQRIHVYGGLSPGHGHQAATATAMENLRELGFAGTFHVYVAADRVAAVSPSTLAPVVFHSDKDQAPPAAFGIAGGTDAEATTISHALQVEHLLIFHLMGWEEPPSVKVSDQRPVLLTGRIAQMQAADKALPQQRVTDIPFWFPGLSRVKLCAEEGPCAYGEVYEPDSLRSMLEQELLEPEAHEKWRAILQTPAQLLPVYGAHISGTTLAAMAKAFARLPSVDDRPKLMVVFNRVLDELPKAYVYKPLTSPDIENLERELKPLECEVIHFADLLSPGAADPACRVLLAHDAPKPVFEHVVRRADLPFVHTGLQSAALTQNLRIPHLDTWGLLPSDEAYATRGVRKLYQRTSRAVRVQASDLEVLFAEFLKQADAPDAALHNFFQTAPRMDQRARRYANRVTLTLLAYLDWLNGS